MLDLTGANLAAYILRICRNVVSSNPRFRQTLGDVSAFTSNRVSFGDAQIIVKNVTAQGTRLSPDYFMFTQRGRGLVAKVRDYPGTFVEWAIPFDESLIDSGVYYIAVNPPTAVSGVVVPNPNEQNATVSLNVKKFKWREGGLINAEGSWVYFASGIDTSTVYIENADTPLSPVTFAAVPGRVLLQSIVNNINCSIGLGGLALVPYRDFWYQRTSTVDIGTSLGGIQTFLIPGDWISLQITDNNGYILRQGIDYVFVSPTLIRVAAWNTPGTQLYVVGIQKINPTTASALNPENILNVTLDPGETLAAGQVFVNTSTRSNLILIANSDGTVNLPYPLNPGEWMRFEIRIDTGAETTVIAKKRGININLIPGYRVAIGDSVTAGDQVAIIIAPQMCETYDVYGSKDNVNFTLDCKANDYSTASEIAELIKQALLITQRVSMERDGITIFEAARDIQGEARDESGTATRYISTLNVSAMCDWKVYLPLVTRVVAIDVTETPYYAGYSSQISIVPRYNELGMTQFISPSIIPPEIVIEINGIPITQTQNNTPQFVTPQTIIEVNGVFVNQYL
jgi:hypothetical protein